MTDTNDLAAEVAVLKKRIREIEDKEKIKDIIYRYCLNFDFGRPEEVVKLFTEDCLFATDAMGEMTYRRGKAALIDRWVNQAPPRNDYPSQHLQLDLVIKVQKDVAHVYNYQLMRHDTGEKVDLSRCAFRSVELRRINGEWLIHEMYSIGINNTRQVQKLLPEIF